MLTTHSHLVPRLKWVGAISPVPPGTFMACSGTPLPFTFSYCPRFTITQDCLGNCCVPVVRAVFCNVLVYVLVLNRNLCGTQEYSGPLEFRHELVLLLVLLALQNCMSLFSSECHTLSKSLSTFTPAVVIKIQYGSTCAARVWCVLQCCLLYPNHRLMSVVTRTRVYSPSTRSTKYYM
jgi:hypothetical protein